MKYFDPPSLKNSEDIWVISKDSDDEHCSDSDDGAAELAADPGPGHHQLCRPAATGGGQWAWQLRRSAL